MQAALLETAGTPLVVVDDIEIEEPRFGEVLVRVSACGLCHSDISVIDGLPDTLSPMIVGHEASGTVETVGPGVTLLNPGDRVVLTPCPPCGTCYWCVRNQANLCVNSSTLLSATMKDGGTRLSRMGKVVYRGLGGGAFAEYVVSPETGAIKIPDAAPLDQACVIGCAVQTGVGAVMNTAKVKPGDTVLVMGLGGIGMSIVQGARLAGASQILCSDPIVTRRELALLLGATAALDPNSDDVVDHAHTATKGIGVDFAFDAVGDSRLVRCGLGAIRRGGMTVCVGGSREDIVIPPDLGLMVDEKRLVGCLLGGSSALRDIPMIMDLALAGRLDLESLITVRRPLVEINVAVADLRAGVGIRTVLTI